MNQRGGTGLIVAVMLIAAACSTSTASSTSAGSSTTAAPPTTSTLPATTTSSSPATTTSSTAAPRSIDLGDHPLIWFGPLPPLPTSAGRPYTGAEDFFELFEPDAEWPTASEYIDVFLLYGEWLGNNATVAQLERIVADLDRRGIAVAVEGSPLTRPDDCGTDYESWGGIPEGRRIAEKFVAAGGVIDLWAMDAPLAYAHFVDFEGACQWEPSQVAAEIDAFGTMMQGYFPDIVIGDTEPFWPEVPTALYTDWLATYEAVTGDPLPFFHLDVDWGRPRWAEDALALATQMTAEGTDFGLFYIGNATDDSDRAWVQLAGERIRAFEQGVGGDPDHVLFQSWHDHPDHSMPDTDPSTFTGLIVGYVDDPAGLGVLRQGPGSNAAFGAGITASGALPGFSPAAAVDGNSETWWGAGDFAPQWIEIDLGASVTVAEVNLLIGQSPDGPTRHRILVGPSSGSLEVAHEFSSDTVDLERLVFRPDTPLAGIRVVRIETLDSPSWISWREIEVIVAE